MDLSPVFPAFLFNPWPAIRAIREIRGQKFRAFRRGENGRAGEIRNQPA